MSIGENIKRKRIEHNYTLEDLANKIGTSRQTIHRYENGIISNIPSDKIEAIAKALNTTPAYLMGWEDEKVKKMLKGAIEYLEDDLAFRKKIENKYDKDVLYLIDKYVYADYMEKALLITFADEDNNTKEIYRKYTLLSDDNKELVNNFILMLYNKLEKSEDTSENK